MENVNYFSIAIVFIVAVALIMFLIWKNKRDRKKMNPDAPDAVEKTITDKQRESDQI